MSKALALRFAKECRRLAYECAEGTAPRMIPGHFDRDGESCAVGWVLKRTAPGQPVWTTFYAVERIVRKPSEYVPTPINAASAVLDANNRATDADRPLALVFPLLWLADEIEARAKGAE